MASTADIEMRTVHVRGARGNSPALRLRLSNLLGQADFRPPGVPPSAVLTVRRLSDPLPGQLAKGRGLARVNRVWERAVRQRLADAYRQAARPYKGRLPAGAEAVVFADRAEWLACVLVDWARGGRASWWWPTSLRKSGSRAPNSAAIEACLCEDALLVPAIVDQLVQWGLVDSLAQGVSRSGARAVGRVVAASFRAAFVAHSSERSDGKASGQASSAPDTSTEEGIVAEAAAWVLEWLPQSVVRTLGLSHVALVVTALTLYHKPRWMREWGLSNDLIALVSEQVSQSNTLFDPGTRTRRARQRSLVGDAGPPDEEAAQGTPEFSTRATAMPPEESPVGLGDEGHQPPSPGRDMPLSSKTTEAKAHDVDGAVFPRTKDVELEAGFATPMSDDASPSAASVERRSGEALSDSHIVEAEEAFAHGIETRLGGVFYLLNLFAALDVPGAFARWSRKGTLGPWALLDLVARGLLDEVGEPLLDDPLWSALAQLDGRKPETLLGEEIVGASDVVVPSAWVSEHTEPDARWVWAARRGRLCVWRKDGAPVALVPCEIGSLTVVHEVLGSLGIVPAHLRRRAFSLAPLASLTGPLMRNVSMDVRPWLEVAIPFLRHRLARALGEECSAETMLQVPGKLYLTSSHVDLVQPLDSLPFAVRRSGLDRDPGWLPGFGRVVLFHFE